MNDFNELKSWHDSQLFSQVSSSYELFTFFVYFLKKLNTKFTLKKLSLKRNFR